MRPISLPPERVLLRSGGQCTASTVDFKAIRPESVQGDKCSEHGFPTALAGYVVGDNNRLETDGVYEYEYDDEGNRTARVLIATGARTEYLWDHRNRLVQVTEKDAEGAILSTVDHRYDVFNQWLGSVVDSNGPAEGGVSERYLVYHDGQIVLEFDGDEPADLAHRYLWGPAVDQILADEQVDSLASAGDVLWPLTDHLGTARDLAAYNSSTDTTSIANHRVYDSFGNLVSETNAAVDHLFGFTGRPFDEESGLQNNLHRWYDPLTGQWMSEDPIGFAGQDSNLNRYVGNEPLMSTDPSGLQEQDARLSDGLARANQLLDLLIRILETEGTIANLKRALARGTVGAGKGQQAMSQSQKDALRKRIAGWETTLRLRNSDAQMFAERLMKDYCDVEVPTFSYWNYAEHWETVPGGVGGKALFARAIRDRQGYAGPQGLGEATSPLDLIAPGRIGFGLLRGIGSGVIRNGADDAARGIARGMKLPTVKPLPPGVLGETALNGSVVIKPGLTWAEKLHVLRHEGVHAFLSVADDAFLAQGRQWLLGTAYYNSRVLRGIEEMLAEGIACRSITAGMKFPFNGAYRMTVGSFTLEAIAGTGALGGTWYAAYQFGRYMFSESNTQ